MRIENRIVGFGDLTGIPVRIYWPPIEQQTDLPIVAFYHGGGSAVGDLDSHDAGARGQAIAAEAIVVSVDCSRPQAFRYNWTTPRRWYTAT